MALEDFVDPQVGIAVAATALVASPQARSYVRRGLVYVMTGVFKLGDAASSGTRSLAQGAQHAASSTGETVESVTTEAPTGTRRRQGARAGGGATTHE